MSIKRTIITALVVTATLVAVVAPMAAGAQTMTAAQLMAEMAQLQAQLAQLQGTTSTNTTTSGNIPAACAGVTFTRNLTVGATGQDVKCLQVILNNNGYQVSATGAGSPGYETMTFGPKTLVAVKKWQAAVGFVPANQIGPMSRAKLNAMLVGGTSTTTTTTTTTTPPVVTLNGPVSAAVSADTPASGAIVSSQATADLLHINFTGSGTVTSVTLQRSGISDQNTLANVYLYDGNTRITDGYSFNVGGQIVMNGLSIAVNGSHVISVKADIASNSIVGSSGTNPASSIAVTLTSYTAGTTPTSANVMGNTMSIVTGSLATVSVGYNTVAVASPGVLCSTTCPSINAGTTQYTFWSAPIQVNTRAVMLKTAAFRMIGSAPSDALANITLFVDGVSTGKTATVSAINGSNYAMFDLTSAPITLTTGSHTVDVRADIQKGSARTVEVSLQQASDLTITDPQVGVNIAAVSPLSSSTGFTANSAGQISIGAGSVTVNLDPTFTSQTNISGGATNAVIGRFIVHAYGEDVKVQTLNVLPSITSACTSGTTYSNLAVTGSSPSLTTGSNGTGATGACGSSLGYLIGNGLQNVTLYFNGSQVGSQQNWTVAEQANSTALAFNLGSQVIAPAGKDSTLEVRADLQTSSSNSYTAGTVAVTLPLGASNAQGQTSQNSANVPAAAVQTTGLSVQSGLLVVSKNSSYANQALNPNTTGARIGSFVIQNQSTSESIRLTSLTVKTALSTVTGQTAAGAQGAGFAPDGVTGGNYTLVPLTNFGALRTSDTTGSGSTPVQPTGNDTFTVSDVLAPGAQMTVDIFANTGASVGITADPAQVQTSLTVASIGSVDNISSSGTIQVGQLITLGTGALEQPSTVVSTTTPSQYIASGTSGATNSSQATYNFVSDNGTSTITELKFATTAGTVTNVCVGSICAAPIGTSGPGSTAIADLTGLNLTILSNGGLTQNVQLSYAPVGTNGLIPPTSSTLALIYVKYQSGGTTTTTGITGLGTTVFTGSNVTDSSSEATFGVKAPTVSLVGSVPTVTVPSTVNSGLILNTTGQQLGQVTVAANASGAIRVNQITFNMGSSGYTQVSPNFESLFIANGNTQITGSSCSTAPSSNVVVCLLNTGNSYGTDFIIPAGQSQTFNLFGQVDGTVISGVVANVSSSVTAAGFKWDDSSYNGTSSHGVGLLGFTSGTPEQTIYNFPTNSYSVHN